MNRPGDFRGELREEQAGVFAQSEFDRKTWIEQRVQEFAEIFAVSVGGLALLDNHLLVRLDPETVKAK